jgi:hypothetical protein
MQCRRESHESLQSSPVTVFWRKSAAIEGKAHPLSETGLTALQKPLAHDPASFTNPHIEKMH